MKFITISLLSVLILQCSSKGIKKRQFDSYSTEVEQGSEQELSEKCGVPDEKYTPSIEIDGGTIKSVARGIVGGDEAVEHSFPWQVWMFIPMPEAGHGSDYGEACGASLISNEWIVTAAHCFIGETGDKVKPICLASESDDFQKDEGNVVITGWGYTSEGGTLSTPLLQAVTTLSWTQCNTVYGPKVNENEICAYSEGLDTCQGDSGGPLMTYDTDHFVLAGIVSWGEGCAEVGKPGVYTSVPFFRGWIRDHTGV